MFEDARGELVNLPLGYIMAWISAVLSKSSIAGNCYTMHLKLGLLLAGNDAKVTFVRFGNLHSNRL